MACNGSPAYCGRKYSNITFVGAHDSPFVGPLAQHNQNIDVVKQLDLGIRFLQGQAHLSPWILSDINNTTSNSSNPEIGDEIEIADNIDDLKLNDPNNQAVLKRKRELELCHTSCFLEDAGTLESYLATVKEWMDADENANEVVTLLLVNKNRVGMDVFDRAFEKSGIKEYAFSPGRKVLGVDEWPTLSDMIVMRKRLVVFLGTLLL